MRPGRFHPGNRGYMPELLVRIGGFNEAGAFPPRKSATVDLSPTPTRCFNEAGAFPPRKSSAAQRGPRPLMRFNEAGAFPPRKSARLRLIVVVVVIASMRPGRFHPGNQRVRSDRRPRRFASMRPGRFHPGNRQKTRRARTPRQSFNEAGAFPPRKSLHVGSWCGLGAALQ